jgi:LacI family gluconate utilization system Gnt-I transcriptional repressor
MIAQPLHLAFRPGRLSRSDAIAKPLYPRGAGPTSAVRLVDVARIAGVAPITVSRALREPDKVSPEARARVERAVAQTGYVPDLVASSLTRGRTRLVGIIVPTLTASIYAATVEGLAETLRRHNFEALIGDSGYTLEGEEKLVAAFLARRADGLVLSNVEHAQGTRRMLVRAGVPVVETGNLTPAPIDMVVGFSNELAARDMLRHLVARGHRTIGFIGAARAANPQAADRRRAYDSTIAEHGLKRAATLAVECPSEVDAAGAALERIVGAHPDVSAVFAASEVRAIGALLQCQRRGWPVPGRIAIAGFNDAGLGQHLVPSLTTVRVPRHEIGRRSAQMILDRIERRPLDCGVVDLGYEIVVRESA